MNNGLLNSTFNSCDSVYSFSGLLSVRKKILKEKHTCQFLEDQSENVFHDGLRHFEVPCRFQVKVWEKGNNQCEK